jgi:hypothetical protein
MWDMRAAVRHVLGHDRATVIQNRPGRVVVAVVEDGVRSVIKFDCQRQRSERELVVLSHLAGGRAAALAPAVHRSGICPDGTSFMHLEHFTATPGPIPWPEIGSALRTLHAALDTLPTRAGMDADWTEFIRRFATRQLSALGDRDELNPAQTREILHQVAMLDPVGTVLVHGDLKQEHVFCGPGSVRFIDYADARIADPRWDLAVLTLDHPDGVEPLLDAYGIDAATRPVVGAYRLVRAMSDVNWARIHGRDTAELLARLHTMVDSAVGAWA